MKKIDLKIFCKNLIDSKNIKDPYDHIDLCVAKSLKIKDIKKIPQKFRYGEYENKSDFFKNDIWRFPPGIKPNYGDELSSSIVF